jgi:hypothetical protein
MRFPGQSPGYRPPPFTGIPLPDLLQILRQAQGGAAPPLGGGASGGLAHPSVIRDIMQNGLRPLTPAGRIPFENFPPGWNDMGSATGPIRNPHFLRRRGVGPTPY